MDDRLYENLSTHLKTALDELERAGDGTLAALAGMDSAYFTRLLRLYRDQIKEADFRTRA